VAPPHPLPDPLIELLAHRFRVIGEPMRIRLLDRLRVGEHSVGELAGALGASQQNVSKHLGVLHEAGIVERRKDGTRVVYGIADPTVFTLCEIVCDGLSRHLADLTALLDGPGAVEGVPRRQIPITR
jgi:DNA-binding transcriptional ArsR family regulator